MALPEIQEFLKELHTADVEPYGRRQLKLNGLVRKVSQTVSREEADNLFDSIEASDPNSKWLKLELANAFQHPGPVLDAFKSEDKVLIERALQFQWIYSGPSSILTLNGNNDLVANVFPRISYTCRKRLVHCLSKFCNDEQRVEKVYRAIEEKYGIASAIKLLPACSQSFIEPILMDDKKVKLTPRQLDQILKRYPDLALSYLNKFYGVLLKERESNKYVSNASYSEVLSKLAKRQPEQFMDLYEKYGDVISCLGFGAKLTRSLLKNEKNLERIMEFSSKYARILHQRQTMKRLDSEKFKRFFTSLLPPSITSFQPIFEIGRQGFRGEKDSLSVWLEKLPREKRFTVLEEAFESVYKKKLLDFPEFMTSRLIQLLPTEERGKWIDLRLTSPDSQYLYQSFGNVPSHREGFWEAFRETSQSIPKLKGFLAVEPDIHRRAELLSMLVLTCRVNDDLKGLEDVCKYVVTRFRNDHIQVRSEFLEALSRRFNLLKLNDEHWTAINELLQISSMNNEFSQDTHCVVRILEKSIQYRLNNKLPVDTQIQHYIKLQMWSYGWGERWNIITKHPELEKQCLKLFASQIAQIYPGGGPIPSTSSVTAGIISMAESIIGWNRRHPKDLMSITDFPGLATRLQEVVEGLDAHNQARVVHALRRDSTLREKYFPQIFKSGPVLSVVPPNLFHFLETDPTAILSNAESIMSIFMRDGYGYLEFLERLKVHGHLAISEKFMKLAEIIVLDEDEVPRKRVIALKMVSILMPAEKFLQLAKKYYPEESKLNVNAEGIEAKYEMSKAVACSLKNTQRPSLGLPVLLEFLKGDYLKFTIGSLVSLCHNAPEAEVISFLKELVDRPVSVKKHAIRLINAIANKQTIRSFLEELLTSEKHHSIREIIFFQVFQLFCLETSDDNWKILKTLIQGLTILDNRYLTSLGSLHNVEHIPDQYLSEYFKISWDVVEGMDKPGPEIKWALASIIQGISPDRISLLDSSFLKGILEKYLFLIHQDQNLESNVAYLAVKYLLYHRKEGQMSTQVDLILDCLKNRLLGPDKWDKPDENIITLYPCKQALSSFIEQLCIEAFKCPNVKLRDDSRAKILMENLIEKLEGVLNPEDIFTDTLLLRLSVIFLSRPEVKLGDDLFEMGKKVGKLADELVQVYSPEIISIFGEIVKRFLGICVKFRLTYEHEGKGSEGKLIQMVKGILSTGSTSAQIIAANSLANFYPKPHVTEDEYRNLITELRSIENKTVKIFVNYKLSNTRPSTGYFDMLV